MGDDDFRIRPGRPRTDRAPSGRRTKSLVGQVVRASRKAGSSRATGASGRGGTGHRGRGRIAGLKGASRRYQRRVVVKARVVRHRGAHNRSAPLARHIAYLERDTATRDAADDGLFDESGDGADGRAFAARCGADRHHFRLIVSPEDGARMEDLRAFTRELLDDMAQDLGTPLDWVAVDHWNTGHPHVHVLVRGVAADGSDLVIDRGYISSGIRARAEERVSLELGPRSEREIAAAQQRDIDAERYTGLDRQLISARGDDGIVDLRPPAAAGGGARMALLNARVRALQRMGLAGEESPGRWSLAARLEPTLRELGMRGDIIKTIHRAMTGIRGSADDVYPVMPGPAGPDKVTGRLVARGLHDELTGEAFAIVEGVDGGAHYLRYQTIEATGDALPGAIVEHAAWRGRDGQEHSGLTVRCDVPLSRQIDAGGATWLDRQLVAEQPETLAGQFGREVRSALEQRTDRLAALGLARREGQSVAFARDLLRTLRQRELGEAARSLAAATGSAVVPTAPGDPVAGIYRERLDLSSGRYAVVEGSDGLRLVPWRRDLDSRLGQEVRGVMAARGTMNWTISRSRGLAV